MTKWYLISLPSIFFVLFSFCTSSQKTLYYRADSPILSDSSLMVLYIPLNKIKSEYSDNTSLKPKIEFNDSFYIEAANGLALFELSNKYEIANLQTESLMSKKVPEIPKKWSHLTRDTGSENQTAQYIIAAASEFNADLIAISYGCKIKHFASRQSGWREGKFGGSYERPISYSAIARFHLQIWGRDGKLLYEKIGIGSTGRPVFYSVFKRKNKGEDITIFARKLFAPPLVRALNEAIRNSLTID